MATNTKKVKKINLTCEVCSERYADPLMLPCLHSFCKECLIKVKDDQGASDDCIKCPTCHQRMPLSGGKVEGLTQNLWLARQVKIASLSYSASNEDTVPCDRCIKRPNSSAVAFCSQCCLHLCSTCKDDHQWSKSTSKHKLIDRKNLKKSIRSIPCIPAFCNKHAEEKLKFFCHTCDVLACRDCLLLNHQNHKFGEATEVASGESKKKIKKCLTEINCHKITSTAEKVKSDGNRVLKKIEKREGEVNAEIDKAFGLLQAAVESRHKAMLCKASKIANKKKKSVKNQQEIFEKLMMNVNQASDLIEQIVESDDLGEILSIKKLVKDQITHCAKVFEESNAEIEENEKFFTSLDVAPLVDEINSFGKISDFCAPACSIDTGIAIPMATVGVERKFTIATTGDAGKPIKYVPIKAAVASTDDVHEIIENVTITSSEECAIVSFVPHRAGKFELQVKVDGQNICRSPFPFIVKEKTAYTHKVKLYFNVGVNTYGVAVDTNGDVYASCNGGYIQVFDNNGTPTRRIGSSGNGDGQFNSPKGLLIVGETLYVTDDSVHRVQMFSTTTSQYIGKFGSNGSGEGQFNQPYGMAYDGKGQILVADCGNRRVQVFTLDGTFVQVINCNSPQDVAVDNNGDIHVVSRNQSAIQVFSSSGAPKNSVVNNNNQANYGRYYNAPTLLGIIAIDDLGQQLVITNNRWLLVFDATGRMINEIGLSLQSPAGITLDKDGNVYIADYCHIHKI